MVGAASRPCLSHSSRPSYLHHMRHRSTASTKKKYAGSNGESYDGEEMADRWTAGKGISRDSRHKRNATGAKRAHYRKKRKFELGRQSANTKIGAKRIHSVRVRGGNTKFRALRLDAGNFAWGSEHATRKCRVISVKYNSTNNELVRTNTLVKGCIVEIDATPFRQWFESHYAMPLGRRGKKPHEGHEEGLNKPRSNHVTRKVNERKEGFKVDQALDDQFVTGRVLARISSRPGQSGRCDGYILEGKELEFYSKKIRNKGK